MFWVIWLLGILVIVAVVGAYLLHAGDVGYGTAFKDLILSLMAISVAAIIISGLVRSGRVSAFDVFQLSAWSARLIIALAWLAVGLGLWRKRRAGAVLVDFGRSKRRTLLSFGAGLALLVLIGDIAWPALRAGATMPQIAEDLILVSLGLYALGLSLPEIRDTGICSFAHLLRWEQVRSYQWKGRTGHTLTVKPGRRWLGLRTVSFTVPPPLWHAVNDTFSERAPDREIGGREPSSLWRVASGDPNLRP